MTPGSRIARKALFPREKTEEEVLEEEIAYKMQVRYLCTANGHKYPDGRDAIEVDGNGGFLCSFYKCKICGFTDCDM